MHPKKIQEDVFKMNTPWISACHKVDGNVVDAVDARQVHPPGGSSIGF